MDESIPVPPLQFPSSLPRKVNGYDRDATEEVFNTVAASYERLWLEYTQLKGQSSEVHEQLGPLREELARYKEEERLLGAAMIEANRSAAAMKEEARREAEAIVNEAQSLVDTMVDEAQAQADKMMEEIEPEVQAKVKQILATAQEERARLQGEIERLREFSNDTHENLSALLVAALKWHRSSLNEGRSIPEAEALEDVLDPSSLLTSQATDGGADDDPPAKPKRLSAPRLSSPS
jgi:cell division septum initiation protein DivIVA